MPCIQNLGIGGGNVPVNKGYRILTRRTQRVRVNLLTIIDDVRSRPSRFFVVLLLGEGDGRFRAGLGAEYVQAVFLNVFRARRLAEGSVWAVWVAGLLSGLQAPV